MVYGSSYHPFFDPLQGPASIPVCGKEAASEMRPKRKTAAASRQEARYMPWLAGIIWEMAVGGKPLQVFSGVEIP